MQDLITFYILFIGFFNFPIREASPLDFELCNAGDETCIIDSIQNIVRTRYLGMPVVGVPSLDPMHIGSLFWVLPDPININISWTNFTMYNYKDAEITSVQGFGVDPEGHHSIRFFIPVIEMYGDYEVVGDFFGLPVNGSGTGKVTAEHANGTIAFEANSATMYGAVYLNVTSLTLIMIFDSFYVDLPNYSPDLGYNYLIRYFMYLNKDFVATKITDSTVASVREVIDYAVSHTFLNYSYSELVMGGL